ncbi:metallophosphoesterase [Neorhizobium tomejilense]|uniref:metallophosphoesterase n=1 Tax=Neorhizobium tomejilense TaxID=2093828 RepID=UPI000CF97F64|nr:metallophosphoesterase [Neorhizobium tomejilense]
MKAWLISDMHITHVEFSRLQDISIPDADICICAGDISDIAQMSMEFLSRHISPRMPVITVLGNHDCYGTTIDAALKVAKQLTSGGNVTALENETVIVGDVRIIGATLWTDFEIPWGHDEEVPLPDRREVAINFCKHYVVDFREIYRSGWHKTGMPGLLTARELIGRHNVSRAFIERELSQPFEGRTVVLTHHAPTPWSLDPQFKGNPTNAAFVTDLTDLIEQGQPDLWVHGHVHRFSDYTVRKTRVICNPKGYRREDTGFRPGFLVEL